MPSDEETERALAEVEAAARVYRRTESAHKKARAAAMDAAITALRIGAGPEAVAKRAPFTGAYLRRKAREAGIPAPETHRPRTRVAA